MDNLFNVDDITVEMPNQTIGENIAKISVIGVGGGGCNMINHMIQEGTHKIDLIAANTDLQVLNISKAPKKIQLGVKLTKGLGAGMKPEIGRDSAVESYEDIKNALSGVDIVFVAAGLGGGTGTGAAAIIAKAAKEVGSLTVSVVTKPFTWEGKKRAGLANLGLEELKKVSDSIIVVPNDRLLDIIDENVGMKDAFKIIDNILYQAVNGMSEVILNPGNSDINTDFADVKTIMQHKGMALMGIGRAKGEDAALHALEDAIDSPLLDKVSLSGAKGILIHFNIHPQVSLFAINNVMASIHDNIDSNAEIIFGTTSDSTLEKDEVKITIVATGFESKNEFDEDYDKDENKDNNVKVSTNDENYLDIPPLMREYVVQYQI
ncbi:cell division protein FtsZ [Malaciobacter molluscorum LMG 25693]|uniref:Cell division protein FtsZ n=1 Tax=Malaciobacter molluscorum LMG 25693 TaxID=870501 RepID=A0A2G1DKW4_9BACT|nr:cell division protein FtsZ [Malaciobacter molluscorum]AXX92620.1 cell division protein FtsZ [Malaciobacter molluscorum LMG 25693]PHO19044.1 cell division protein FtsZ [Malaciobacter molluscorum LMG 25693]RXJ97350.1 cell division protein FtsZ [Malaciobacter molluscorum]